MTRPRSQIISLADTPFYHCVFRCVRRAFLCDEVRYSGQNCDHRKPWLVDHLALLGETLEEDTPDAGDVIDNEGGMDETN